MLLTDDQWIIIEGLILGNSSTSKRHTTSPDRERFILECILWKLATGVPWYVLPDKILNMKYRSIMKVDHNHLENDSEDIVEFFSEVFGFQVPSYQTIYRRYLKWNKVGKLKKVLSVLRFDLKTRGGLDISCALSDGLIQFEKCSKKQEIFSFSHTSKLSHNSLKVTLDPQIPKSWQLKTAILILSIVARQVLNSSIYLNFTN